MNILITVQTYYPRKDGVQTVTQYIAEGLISKGYNVTVITKKHGNDLDEEVYNGVRIKRIYLSTKCGLYFGNKNEYKRIILNECMNNDIMINVCTQNAFTDLLLNDLDKFNIKKILYLHGMFDFKFHKYDFKNIKTIINKIWKNIRWYLFYKFNNENFKKYDRVINIHSMVPGTKFFKEKYGITPMIIENAADDSFFDISRKNKQFICVSNYTKDKNQEFVLRAYYASKLSNNYSMIFIGSRENKYLDYLKNIDKQLSIKYGKRDVKFITNLSRENTIKYIKESKLFLFGSKHEMFPLSIVEAISSKTPYVSTNVGCVENLPGGFVVKNVEEMSFMIDELCNDNKLYDAIGHIGYEYAKKHFNISEKIEDLDILFKNIKEEKNEE